MAEMSDASVGDLSDWELSCLDEWDKGFVVEERRISTEAEKNSHRLWSSFQNSASAVSQLYKDGSQTNGISLWVPFQSAAGHVTSLYKDSQELIRKSFELGNQLGHHRRNKELVSWMRKRRRTLPREEIVAFVCEKPVPASRHKSFGRGGNCRRTVEIMSPKFRVSSPAQDFSADGDFKAFKDVFPLQGLNDSTGTASLRPLPNPLNERISSFTTDELHGCNNSRKRIKSGGEISSPGSPSHKRTKVCRMETEDL